MIAARVIPCLLLKGGGLVKTVRFGNPVYVGDPRIAVRIFNDKEVDELILLDIAATPERREPNYGLIEEIVSEAFMPVAYGGGLVSVEQARRIIGLGVEKIVVSTAAVERPAFVEECASILGSQSVLVCLDVRRTLFGRYEVRTHGGSRGTKLNPAETAQALEAAGAGEIVINSIDRDGTMQGFDLALISSVASCVRIPVIACGGAGTPRHLADALHVGRASAVAAGSMFVFRGRHRAVLISYLTPAELDAVLSAGA